MSEYSPYGRPIEHRYLTFGCENVIDISDFVVNFNLVPYEESNVTCSISHHRRNNRVAEMSRSRLEIAVPYLTSVSSGARYGAEHLDAASSSSFMASPLASTSIRAGPALPMSRCVCVRDGERGRDGSLRSDMHVA